MKKIFLLNFLIVALLVLSFGCKKTRNKSMTIVRGCSGIYLKYEGKDYRVCNVEKMSQFPNGTKVEATVKKVDCESCVDYQICLVYHPYEGCVKIEEIKQE